MRRTSRAPASSASAVSLNQSVDPGTSTGSTSANAPAVARTATPAAGVRTNVSASASQNARTNCSGSTNRNGRDPSTGNAYAAAGIAPTSFVNHPRSPGSNGATRHAPYPLAVTSGTTRPRPTNPTPAHAAAAHTRQLREPPPLSTVTGSGWTAAGPALNLCCYLLCRAEGCCCI